MAVRFGAATVVTVTSVSPTATALTSPLALTVAMDVSALSKVTSLSSRVQGKTLAVMTPVMPRSRFMSSGRASTPVASEAGVTAAPLPGTMNRPFRQMPKVA